MFARLFWEREGDAHSSRQVACTSGRGAVPSLAESMTLASSGSKARMNMIFLGNLQGEPDGFLQIDPRQDRIVVGMRPPPAQRAEGGDEERDDRPAQSLSGRDREAKPGHVGKTFDLSFLSVSFLPKRSVEQSILGRKAFDLARLGDQGGWMRPVTLPCAPKTWKPSGKSPRTGIWRSKCPRPPSAKSTAMNQQNAPEAGAQARAFAPEHARCPPGGCRV